MAPNKFEKRIKKQLQEREIRPSADAWNRISEQLEVAEEPKSKSFFRYGIAAGFIGLLMVFVWYFNTDGPVADPQTVEKGVPVNSLEKEQKLERILEERIPEDNIVEKEETKPVKTFTIASQQKLNKEVKTPDITIENSHKRVEKVSMATRSSDELINTKIAEIIAQVELLEKENMVVTDAEIDALLLKAQQEVLENKIFLKDSSVDASTLLADVEDELDKSFRDQIFDALKDGFVKVRTAVADRNK